MPFFEDLQGESEAILEDVKMTAKKIGSNKDVSTTIYRQNMWGASNLSAALAGADPMKAIGDLVAGYWARDMQKELIAILSGVFGTTTAGAEGTPAAETRMKDHILDLTTGKTSFLMASSPSTPPMYVSMPASFLAMHRQNLAVLRCIRQQNLI